MASFQAKIGWKRLRKREKIKIIILFRSYPTRKNKLQKNSKKIQKIRKYHNGFISGQNRLEKAEKERKKKLPFRFVHTRRVIENYKKKLKKLKNTITTSFQAKIGWKR